MAKLKDTVIQGSLRVTNEIETETLYTNLIKVPTSSNGATYNIGTNNYVLKSNGSSTYWAADNNSTGYVATAQGAANSGKFLVVDASGNVVPTALADAI